jgi:hypothetical protein
MLAICRGRELNCVGPLKPTLGKSINQDATHDDTLIQGSLPERHQPSGISTSAISSVVSASHSSDERISLPRSGAARRHLDLSALENPRHSATTHSTFQTYIATSRLLESVALLKSSEDDTF